MHEMGLAKRLIEITMEELQARGIRFPAVEVRAAVGPLSGIAPDSLLFYFDICKDENPVTRSATLVIRKIALTGRCPACSASYDLDGQDFRCKACGDPLILDKADDLVIESIKVEGD